ncbi:MAG: ATP-binding protein [Chloroflexi bacterium]|nr:ATP-binding protein [Chloroflexota bacterium]
MLPDFRVRQRDYLLEISRALTSRLDLSEVLRLILQLSTEILNGQAALVALVDEDGRYRIRTSYGVAQPLLDQLRPLLDEIEDPRKAEESLRRNLVAIAQRVGLGFWQVVWLPMQIGEEFLGALYVYRMRGSTFSGNDRRVLQSFADQAAIAVNNARLYQQVNQDKRRLDAILEFSADGVAIMDVAHRIVTFNRKLIELTGVNAADALGKRFEDVLTLQNQRAGRSLDEAEAQGWPLHGNAALFVEGDLRRPDGRFVPVEINFAPLLDAHSRMANIIANVHDLTRLRMADEMKSTFVSAVSHELKTPVALIKGYASTLRRHDAAWDEETVRDSLQVIEEESDRLAELIDNLLDASRAQAGNFRIDRVELDIDELVRRVITRFQAQTKSHTLIADVPADLPLVFADEARITQVLNNLVSNAVKYSPAGSIVHVTSSVDNTTVVISVSDEGTGIPAEDQERLFKRFQRLEGAVRKSIPGTGLGLYLCKSIIDAHGGQIWVESDGKKGSTFRFSLPRS